MALNPLIINKNYFGGVQARGDFIKAGDIDRQFVTISSYINKFIVPTLNQLISSQIPGSNNPVDAKKNLINVGDGTTKWDFPKAEYIPDYSLPLSKLVQANPGSILATDNNQIFRAVTPASSGLALTARVQNTPIWKKIVGNDSISNRVITSEKIALNTLIAANFPQGFFKKFISAQITTDKIQAGSIASIKIATGAVNSSHFGGNLPNQLCGINGSTAILWGNTLPDGFIGDPSYINHWGSGIAPIDHTKLAPNFYINPISYSRGVGHKAFTTVNIADGAISSFNIKEKSLSGARMTYAKTIQLDPMSPKTFLMVFLEGARNPGLMFEDGCVGINELPFDYKAKLGL